MDMTSLPIEQKHIIKNVYVQLAPASEDDSERRWVARTIIGLFLMGIHDETQLLDLIPYVA
jgi:hypothetical protein